MPQAAIGALTTFFVSLGASAAVATFAATVFVYASTAYLLNRIAANAARPGGGIGSGTEINYYDSGAGGRIAYGMVKTGGMETIPALTGGDNNEILVKALTLAIHEVDSYRSFAFDDREISRASVGAVTGTASDGLVNSGSYRDHAWIRAYRGTSTDSADYRLRNGGFGAFFDTNFRGLGIAKVLVDFKFNRDIYQAVPTVTATYQGKRCYDPRLDVTPGASPTNSSYIRWTRNPALCLCDYLMGTYGGEYESDDIDWSTVVTAANYCDGQVAIPGEITQARYTCNGVLVATDSFEDNVKTLVNAMLGRVIFHDGKWRVHAGSWQTPTFTIQKSDWINGGLSIKFEQGRKVRFNRMRAWYVDPNRDWQRVQSTARYNSIYQVADFETIDAETDQILCTNEYEAQRKSEFLLRASRNQIVVIGRLPPRFQNIAMWNTGTIVFDHLGWSSKTFRAVGIDMNPDGSMDCVFQEEQSTDWTDMAAADYNAESMVLPPLVNWTIPTPPPGFSVTQQINGTLLFDWTTPVIKPFNTEFQIIRSTNSADASVGTIVWQGLANPVALVMPNSRHWYYIRSVANSALTHFSIYQPNTFGISGLPRLEADNTLQYRMIGDPDFTYGAASSLWKSDETNIVSGFNGSTFNVSSATYNNTGGQFDGFMRLQTGVTTTNFVSPAIRSVYLANSLGRPVENVPFCVEVNARVRVNSTVSFIGMNSYALFFGMEMIYSTTNSSALKTVIGYPQALIEGSPTIGEWVTYSKRFVIPLGRNSTGLLGVSQTGIHATPRISFTGSPGQVDIDYIQVEAFGITNKPEASARVTGNYDLFWADCMRRIVFVNTSAARTLTWADDHWDTQASDGTRYFVSKHQSIRQVYINPASGMTLRLSGRASVGTITMIQSLIAEATLEKTGPGEITAFGSGLA